MALPRMKYQVFYTGNKPTILHIIPEKLAEANRGNVQSQKYLIYQYAKANKRTRLGYIEWHKLKFVPLDEPGRPPRHNRDADDQPATPQLKQGCTCEIECGACNQGWHRSCKYGCQFGEPLN